MLKLSNKLDDIVKYLVATMLLVVPLYPKFPLITVPGTFVSIRLEDFVLVFAALVLVIIILPQISTFIKETVGRSILIYLFVGLMSLISALLVTKTITPHIGFLHFIRRVEYFVPFFIGVYAIKSKRGNLEFYIKTLMITMSIMFLYGLGQKYLTWPIIITQNLEYSKGIALRYISGGHLNSTFAGHYDLGTFLVFILPVLISMFFFVKKLKEKIVILGIFSGGLWLLAFSGSRVSSLSYLIASFVALLAIKRIKAFPIVVAFSLLVFSLSPNLVSRYGRIIEVTVDKVKSFNKILLINPEAVYAQNKAMPLQRRDVPTPTPTPLPVFEDRSTSIRLNVEWPRAIRALSKNPLLGTGYSSITLATDNDYLRLLGEVGILGTMAFMVIFAHVAKAILAKLPIDKYYTSIESAYLGGFYGGVVGVFINAFFIDVFEASKFAILFWLFMGMTLSLVKNKSK